MSKTAGTTWFRTHSSAGKRCRLARAFGRGFPASLLYYLRRSICIRFLCHVWYLIISVVLYRDCRTPSTSSITPGRAGVTFRRISAGGRWSRRRRNLIVSSLLCDTIDQGGSPRSPASGPLRDGSRTGRWYWGRHTRSTGSIPPLILPTKGPFDDGFGRDGLVVFDDSGSGRRLNAELTTGRWPGSRGGFVFLPRQHYQVGGSTRCRFWDGGRRKSRWGGHNRR